VDGAIAGWEWGKRYAFYEVVPQVIETDVFHNTALTMFPFPLCGRCRRPNRKIFLEVGRRVSIEFGEAMKKERDDYKDFMRGKASKYYPFLLKKAKWADFPEVKGLIKGWIDQTECRWKAGHRGDETFLDNFGISKWMPPGY